MAKNCKFLVATDVSDFYSEQKKLITVIVFFRRWQRFTAFVKMFAFENKFVDIFLY